MLGIFDEKIIVLTGEPSRAGKDTIRWTLDQIMVRHDGKKVAEYYAATQKAVEDYAKNKRAPRIHSRANATTIRRALDNGFIVLNSEIPSKRMSADQADDEGLGEEFDDRRPDNEGEFDPTSIKDARDRIWRTVTQRRGQKVFRETLMIAYGGQCVISGCSIRDILEAAHIHPYLGPHTNNVTNGLLLRADLHTLFDCGLLTIDPEAMTVRIAQKLLDSEYGVFDSRRLAAPKDPTQRPSKGALKMHRRSAGL